MINIPVLVVERKLGRSFTTIIAAVERYFRTFPDADLHRSDYDDRTEFVAYNIADDIWIDIQDEMSITNQFRKASKSKKLFGPNGIHTMMRHDDPRPVHRS